MKVSVIIVSYNFEQWITRCLDSLRASTTPLSVIVVDNASSDKTVEIIRQQYPEVYLIETGANLGFGRANNIGIEYAIKQGAEYCFLLNQDAWIDQQTIEVLVSLSQEYISHGVLSPVHLNGRGDELDFGFATYSGLKSKEELASIADELITTRFVNAAFWMIPTKVLKVVGGFSPLFYHYGEDIDFINRLTYHGYLLGYSPNVFGCHDRENRLVTRAAIIRSEWVYLLSEYANVNYPFYKAFGFGVLASVKKSLIALKKGELNNVIAFTKITAKLLAHTYSVLSTRKMNREKSLKYS